MRVADELAIKRMIVAILGAMPNANPELDDAEDLVDLYYAGVRGYPMFAVQNACEQVMRGRVGQTGGRFRPTPAELALEVERQASYFAKERVQIRAILQATVAVEKSDDPDKRSEIIADVRKLINELANARPPNEIARGVKADIKVDDGMTPKERAEKRLDELKDQPLPQLSERAMAIFNDTNSTGA